MAHSEGPGFRASPLEPVSRQRVLVGGSAAAEHVRGLPAVTLQPSCAGGSHGAEEYGFLVTAGEHSQGVSGIYVIKRLSK